MENKENNENNENKKDYEEFVFDDRIREHIIGLIDSAEEVENDDEVKSTLERIALDWYKEFSKVHIDSNRLIYEHRWERWKRESEEEVKKSELEAEKKKFVISVIAKVVEVGLTLGVGTAIPVAVYNRQINKIMASEYCNDKFILNKNLENAKSQLLRTISRYNR